MTTTDQHLQAVIFDWAGTTIDYGSLAPVAPFLEVFHRHGIELTIQEARKPMGLYKRDHIKALFKMESVRQKWLQVHQQYPQEQDVERLFEEFIPLQLKVLEQHADPIPGCLECLRELRQQGLKIGTTTGYDRQMMEVLIPIAKEKGFIPDSIVCVSDVPAGRPAPWMAVVSAMQMSIYPFWTILKVGDTIADIEEGLNAGMWTAAVVLTGNAFGLPEERLKDMPNEERLACRQQAEWEFRQAGAHFVVDGIWEVPAVVEEINRLLGQGKKP